MYDTWVEGVKNHPQATSKAPNVMALILGDRAFVTCLVAWVSNPGII